MKNLLFSALLLLLPALANAAPLPVVASFSILGDMTRAIGGDAVSVRTLVGPDGDTHSYQPTPADAKTVAGAQLIIANGLGFEGWLDRLVAASGTRAKVVAVSAGLPPRTMDEDGRTVTDPHTWQSLANGRAYARSIATALEAALPDQAPAIAARAAAYDAQLATLDSWVRQQIGSVPPAQRRIITSHDAFGYFGAAYGVSFSAPEGVSTESEPSAAAIARLTDQLRAGGIRTVFFENMSNGRLLKQIAKDTGAVIGGTLYADALSPADGPAATYPDMFRHNVPLLVAAMQDNQQGNR